jgi:hypothetical protein
MMISSSAASLSALALVVHIFGGRFFPLISKQLYVRGKSSSAIYCDYADIELVKNVFRKKSPSFEAEMEKKAAEGLRIYEQSASYFIEFLAEENEASAFFPLVQRIASFGGTKNVN